MPCWIRLDYELRPYETLILDLDKATHFELGTGNTGPDGEGESYSFIRIHYGDKEIFITDRHAKAFAKASEYINSLQTN